MGGAHIPPGDHVLAEPAEDGGHLGPGGRALGAEGGAGGAGDEPCGVGPGQGLGGVGAHQPGVAVAGQVCPGGGVIPLVLGVAVEEGGQLLPGDGIACPEVGGGDAAGDVVLPGPGDRVVEPGRGGHVPEGVGPVGGGLAGQAVEDGDHLSPGGGALRGEEAAVGAVHQVVLIDVGDVVVGPMAGGHVGEGVFPRGQGGAGEEGKGQAQGQCQAEQTFLHGAAPFVRISKDVPYHTRNPGR